MEDLRQIPLGDYLRVRARKQINKPNGEGLGITGLLAAVHLPSGGVEGRSRGNDLTNIRKPSAISWCPCRDVWLEALERLTLSFCLSDRSHM